MKINLPNTIEIGAVRSRTDCQMGMAGSAALRPSREIICYQSIRSLILTIEDRLRISKTTRMNDVPAERLIGLLQ